MAVAAGTVLPHLTRRDAALLAHEGDDDEDTELARLRAQVLEWRAEAARRGKPLRLPFMPFFLRNIWTGALLLFTVLTLATFFVTKVWQAIIIVSLVGICWAVACWAPFAIIMEFLKERERDASEDGETIAREWARRPSHSRALSTPVMRRNSRPAEGERTPLLRRRSFDQHNPDVAPAEAVAGGTILGIHNLAIVMPQFIVALASSAIFAIVDADADNDPSNDTALYGKNGVAWVLRFGGVCTLVRRSVVGVILAMLTIICSVAWRSHCPWGTTHPHGEGDAQASGRAQGSPGGGLSVKFRTSLTTSSLIACSIALSLFFQGAWIGGLSTRFDLCSTCCSISSHVLPRHIAIIRYPAISPVYWYILQVLRNPSRPRFCLRCSRMGWV